MILNLTSTLIYDSFRLIEFVEKIKIYSTDTLGKYVSVNSTNLIETLCKMNYISKDEKDCFYVSWNNKLFHEEKKESVIEIRDFIKKYILTFTPSWSSRIIYGRKELLLFLNYEEKRCFSMAKLFNDTSKEVIEWWDLVSACIRERHNISCNEIGRQGEYLTIEYEKTRISQVPELMSIESNLLGYDILSYVDSSLKDRLFIEVKTTTDSNDGKIIITSNEWNIAKNNHNYIFYIWIIKKEKILIKKTVNEMMKHIPDNNGAGTWNAVTIPIKQIYNSGDGINYE